MNIVWATFVAVTFFVWFIEATLWFALVALIVRPLGIRMPIWWWSKPESVATVPGPTRWQYVLVEGVLKYGAGSWLLLSTANYIDDRFEGRPFFGKMKIGFFLIGLAGFMLMGFSVGLADWARRRRQHFTSPD